MKKVQYSYLPADSAAVLNSREAGNSTPVSSPHTPPPPDEDTVARLNALAKEYPFCAWGKAWNSTLL